MRLPVAMRRLSAARARATNAAQNALDNGCRAGKGRRSPCHHAGVRMIRRILQFYTDGLLRLANGMYPKDSIIALKVDLASRLAALQFDFACCLMGVANPPTEKGKA
jgi:hypothetical protein